MPWIVCHRVHIDGKVDLASAKHQTFCEGASNGRSAVRRLLGKKRLPNKVHQTELLLVHHCEAAELDAAEERLVLGGGLGWLVAWGILGVFWDSRELPSQPITRP